MLALERRNIIIERLNSDGKILVGSLSKEFNVSEETIRRDIEKLSLEGLAIKTYGGALSINKQIANDLPYNIRKSSNIEGKQKIAEKVAEMIKDGDRIMFDSSSTALFVVKQIKNKKNITVITNSIEILFELGDKTGWHIFSTGGSLREGAFSLSGGAAERMILDHHVDLAICSAKGIDINMGITDSNDRDAEIKRAIFKSASTKIVCLDHSKFNEISFSKVCGIESIDVLVTDKDPGESWKKRLADEGVTVEIYGENNENTNN